MSYFRSGIAGHIGIISALFQCFGTSQLSILLDRNAEAMDVHWVWFYARNHVGFMKDLNKYLLETLCRDTKTVDYSILMQKLLHELW